MVTEGNLSESETAYFLGSLVEAAFDTTQVAISSIIMAPASFPKAQAVVHAQLDAIVGQDALPGFVDWTSLTRVQAFILEALRWRPVNPFGHTFDIVQVRPVELPRTSVWYASTL
ncbi:hypothetical protein JVU11DRAFT_9588 [Chiua virens]|nr:hypothetical protein JVU11DRAFT_9588 [Chiua virens]